MLVVRRQYCGRGAGGGVTKQSPRGLALDMKLAVSRVSVCGDSVARFGLKLFDYTLILQSKVYFIHLATLSRDERLTGA